MSPRIPFSSLTDEEIAEDSIYFCIADGDPERLQWLYNNYTLAEAYQFYAAQAAMSYDED